MNIIFVSGAAARARTLTLDWRHWTLGSLSAAGSFHRLHASLQLRHAALRRGDQASACCRRSFSPTSARRRRKRRKSSRATSMRWRSSSASCRRRCCGSTVWASGWPSSPGSSRRSCRSRSSRVACRDAAVRRRRCRASCRWTSSARCSAMLSRDVEERSDQLGVLEALLVTDSAKRKFLPTLVPIEDGWFSSNFGWRIDPFTGAEKLPRRHRLSGRGRNPDRRRCERQGHLRGGASRLW